MSIEPTTPLPDARLSQAAFTLGWSECWRILREHGKTFHLMARVLGEERGNAIAALYGFARVADDMVDEPAPGDTPDRIRAKLRWMQEELRRAVSGESREPRFAVLGHTIRRYGIPLEPFDDLVAGVATDIEPVRFATFRELERYCYQVAGTVGLMITPVAGYRGGSRALEHAKTLGTAMQLTNILRDVGEDLDRGRIYLPSEERERFGVTEESLSARRLTPEFAALMKFSADRARGYFREGMKILPLVDADARLATRLMGEVYLRLLDEIERRNYDVFTRKIRLSSLGKAGVVLRTLLTPV